ncbi:S9 family peptidase [Olivibacter sitiensis]|uniref:S9 family peptidase n=1 Tax=Olivibacter sitiensis TaxID=376470 RepID=UPI00042113F0|nr:S9 family peptidase [Olivibacter sitiensis]
MNKTTTFLLSLSIACSSPLFAQVEQAKHISASDYEHAEKFLAYHTEQYVDRATVSPNWLPNERFWYRVLTAEGSEFVLVDAAKGTRKAAFDHQRLASALSLASGKQYQASMLPFHAFSFSPDGQSILFKVGGKQWKCDLKSYVCTEGEGNIQDREANANGEARSFRLGATPESRSPDGKKAVFIKNNNLWIKDIASKEESQLTTDGVQDFGYATDNAGWKTSDRPILLWSPDSKKIATFKQDQRLVSDMYLVPTNVGKPTLKTWKYPFAGDKEVAMIHRVIIDVQNKKVVPLKVDPDPHRSTVSDDIATGGVLADVNWSPDGDYLAFVSTSRDHKQEKVRIANALTGDVREVFEETVATQFESGWRGSNWRYLHGSGEFIWFSERDDWGHLYLYDASTGQLKNQITTGEWLVSRLVKIDEKKRTIYFMANGLQKENPYYAQLCQIGFDGKDFKVLTPEAGNHSISLSPSEQYFIDSYSKLDVPPVITLRRINGKLVNTLEQADISRLAATGWKPATPVSVKAHDGKTDLYGLMFTPTRLDPGKKYPVIDYIYPGPQGGSIGNWSFASARGDHQALAELGFVVVLIEGTSNPYRSKSFHDMSYGNMAENTLPDQITAIRQLAQRYPFMDLDRVGIWGHSGGGFATAAAMFRYPDFFKVGISESGNHDNRNYEDDWGERYNGLVENSDYEAQANQNYAKNLKGKLLLAHGLMDNNVPPVNTFLVIEALQRANKDYDLIVFPNSAHGFGEFSPYMMRRRWDYFVRHLKGAEPPHEYLLKSASDKRNKID